MLPEVPGCVEVEGCPLPDDRWYDLENDVWVRSDAARGGFLVGIDALLSGLAGKFASVRFRETGERLERGRSVATLESVRFTGPVRMPVDGTVVLRNDALVERPKLLNDSPYDRGWVVQIRPADPASVPRLLEPADAIRDRAREKIAKFRIHCYPAAPDVEMYEIGSECSAILARLDEEMARRAADEVVLLVADDPTAPIEMVRWADRSGHTVLHHRKEGSLHHFLVRREGHPQPRLRSRESGQV